MKLFLLLMTIALVAGAPSCQRKVVLMGDSITSEWPKHDPSFFTDKPYINKGISGETTAQMLARFQADVIALKPRVVVILAGTNDIAQNQGPVSLEETFGNIRRMVEMARAARIGVVLCSVLPVYDYYWKPGLQPDQKIPVLNRMISGYAREYGIPYVDYFSAMIDERNGLKKQFTADGVHPNQEGYQVMGLLLEAGVKREW